MKYKVTIDDIKECFEFAVKYHLDPKKVSSSRTSGAARGLGEELDSFLGGKLVEIAVIRILKKLYRAKECNLDFVIKKINEVHDEPDIINIIENKKSRKPKLFVEIKRSSSTDRWVGLTIEQYSTIKKSQPDASKIYIIGASVSVINKRNVKENDLLGCYLKKATKLSLFNNFANIKDCLVEIEYVISGKELEGFGTVFNKNGFFYETNLFKEVLPMTKKQIKKLSGRYKKVRVLKNEKLPPFKPIKTVSIGESKRKLFSIPKVFFPLNINGKLTLYKKKNEKSLRQFVECNTNVVITSSVLGKFRLAKGKIYQYNITTIGRNPVLARNNIWIARNKLGFLIEKGKIGQPGKILKTIAEKI